MVRFLSVVGVALCGCAPAIAETEGDGESSSSTDVTSSTSSETPSEATGSVDSTSTSTTGSSSELGTTESSTGEVFEPRCGCSSSQGSLADDCPDLPSPCPSISLDCRSDSRSAAACILDAPALDDETTVAVDCVLEALQHQDALRAQVDLAWLLRYREVRTVFREEDGTATAIERLGGFGANESATEGELDGAAAATCTLLETPNERLGCLWELLWFPTPVLCD